MDDVAAGSPDAPPGSSPSASPPGSSPAASVELRRAGKRFGLTVALDGVDLAVPAGAFCVLLGPSGSGKTTLLRCIAGIERLSSGQIWIEDRLVADGTAHLPRKGVASPWCSRTTHCGPT
jgi:iron(III) transport system ATP-binding protein